MPPSQHSTVSPFRKIIDRFSQSVWAGSSLIISDEGLNKETGPATDFIVVSSADPQGGLKTHIERTANYTDGDQERLYRRAPDERRTPRYTDNIGSDFTGALLTRVY